MSKRIAGKITTRHLGMFGLLAAPWAGFLAIALKPSPRRMWAQRWPTITFVGLYQLALDRCVEIDGVEHIPASGPVILAVNHINSSHSSLSQDGLADTFGQLDVVGLPRYRNDGRAETDLQPEGFAAYQRTRGGFHHVERTPIIGPPIWRYESQS